MDYENYEAECDKIREDNEQLLDDFEVWLKKSKIKSKTINNHIANVDLYINDFLLYEDAVEAKEGASDIGMYLGYWFIKKVSWSSPAQIKSNAASLKKFYTFLYEKKMINKKELDRLKEKIKEEMSEWIATVRRYHDPSIEDMETVWGL